MLVYEDNFASSTIREPEERAFFDFVRRQSVLTLCERCERPVRLIPPKALCASCLRARIWRAGLDERIWQSGNASGHYSSVVRGAFFPSSAASCVATLSSK